MKLKIKLLILIIITILIYFIQLKFIPNKKYKYYFLQQYEDTCHISCWYNFKLLQNLRKKHRFIMKESLKDLDLISKYHSYSIDSKLALSWHQQVVSMSKNNILLNKYPKIKEFFNNMFENGIIVPNIYIDKECKKTVFDNYGIKGLLLFYFIAGSCANFNDVQKTKVNIFGFKKSLESLIEFPTSDLTFPYYVTNKNEKKIFNFKLGKFVDYNNIQQIADYYNIDKTKITIKKNIINKKLLCDLLIINIKDNNIYLYLPNQTNKKKTYGWQIVNNNKGIGLLDNNITKNKIIVYGTNVVYLLFLNLGIDTNNNIISKKHKLYETYLEIKKSLLYSPFSSNMWNIKDNEFLTKNNFYQYKLANLFKNDNNLKENFIDLLEKLPLPIWEIYNNMGNYYNHNCIKINKTKYKDFILGKDQMLSYLFSIIIWLCWKGSYSIKAFADCLQAPFLLGYVLWKKFYYAINIKNKNNISILDILEKINNYFKPMMKDYVSVASHGYVISYNNDLIKLQIEEAIKVKEKINNIDLLKKLPAIIDSWNADKMPGLFYKILVK